MNRRTWPDGTEMLRKRATLQATYQAAVDSRTRRRIERRERVRLQIRYAAGALLILIGFILFHAAVQAV